MPGYIVIRAFKLNVLKCEHNKILKKFSLESFKKKIRKKIYKTLTCRSQQIRK